MGALAVFTYLASRHVAAKFDEKINGYSLIKLWEVQAQMQELAEHRMTFSRHCLNESHLIGKYMEYKLLSFSLATSENLGKLQAKHSRQNLKTVVKSKLIYPSVKAIGTCGFLALLFTSFRCLSRSSS